RSDRSHCISQLTVLLCVYRLLWIMTLSVARRPAPFDLRADAQCWSSHSQEAPTAPSRPVDARRPSGRSARRAREGAPDPARPRESPGADGSMAKEVTQ